MCAKYTYSLLVTFVLGVLLLGCGARMVTVDVPERPEKASFRISTSLIHEQYQGFNAEVSISADSARDRLGGYDFFLSYNPKALTFIASKPGDLLTTEGWDIFDYQVYPGSQIDKGDLDFIHLFAAKDTLGVEHHPNDSLALSNQLATLQFDVTNNRAYECTFQPIRFYWRNCNDNVLSLLSGDTVAFVQNVYDTALNVPVADTIYIPGWQGPFADCHTALHDVPVPMIDFINGGLDIMCIDISDPRGDINVNGLEYEAADAAKFADYFIDGPAAFGHNLDAATWASDVNRDGKTLSLADLVFLIRTIQGNARPYSPVSDTGSIAIYMSHRSSTMTLATQSDSAVGAIYMVFDASDVTGPPSLGPGADRMDLKYNIVNDSLRVLIFNIGNGDIDPGMQTILTIPAPDTVSPLYVEAATFSGIPMKADIESGPQEFILGHNDPNPFSISTTIPLMLPVETDWSVCILNVAADTVRTFSGHSAAGIVEIEWDGTWRDGSPADDGTYLYRAVVGDLSVTHRMTLVR